MNIDMVGDPELPDLQLLDGPYPVHGLDRPAARLLPDLEHPLKKDLFDHNDSARDREGPGSWEFMGCDYLPNSGAGDTDSSQDEHEGNRGPGDGLGLAVAERVLLVGWS